LSCHDDAQWNNLRQTGVDASLLQTAQQLLSALPQCTDTLGFALHDTQGFSEAAASTGDKPTL
jgi:hypothetical protein